MKHAVISLDNEQVGEIDLADAVFGVEPRADILQRMVTYQLAKRRRGTHKTKGISEISGTTRKPFRQKGTGRARQGSARAAGKRGGQTTFGPQPRSHAIKLPKKVRRLALKHALSAKQRAGKLIVIDALAVDEAKTKPMAARLAKLGLTSALVVDGAAVDRNFALAARNIALIDVLPEQGVNVYDVLRRDTLVLSRAAVSALEERLA